MLRTFPLLRSQQKKRTISVGSIQVLNRFSGKLRCLPFSKIIRKFYLVESEMERIFLWQIRSEVVDYPHRQTSISVRNGTAEISLPFRRLSCFQSLISRQQLLEMVSVISFGCIADFGETLTITSSKHPQCSIWLSTEISGFFLLNGKAPKLSQVWLDGAVVVVSNLFKTGDSIQ